MQEREHQRWTNALVTRIFARKFFRQKKPAQELAPKLALENLYYNDLDKDALGLREVAQIDSYKGFVFATMDPTAPSLLTTSVRPAGLASTSSLSRGIWKLSPESRSS